MQSMERTKTNKPNEWTSELDSRTTGHHAILISFHILFQSTVQSTPTAAFELNYGGRSKGGRGTSVKLNAGQYLPTPSSSLPLLLLPELLEWKVSCCVLHCYNLGIDQQVSTMTSVCRDALETLKWKKHDVANLSRLTTWAVEESAFETETDLNERRISNVRW